MPSHQTVFYNNIELLMNFFSSNEDLTTFQENPMSPVPSSLGSSQNEQQLLKLMLPSTEQNSAYLSTRSDESQIQERVMKWFTDSKIMLGCPQTIREAAAKSKKRQITLNSIQQLLPRQGLSLRRSVRQLTIAI